MPVRILIALAACLAALALPAAAAAQGAGDDQYADPFGSEQQDPEPAQATPAPAAPSPSPAPAAPSSAAPSPQPAPAAAQSAAELPYTGADAGLVGLAGVVLLAGGVALRVRLRDPL